MMKLRGILIVLLVLVLSFAFFCKKKQVNLFRKNTNLTEIAKNFPMKTVRQLVNKIDKGPDLPMGMITSYYIDFNIKIMGIPSDIKKIPVSKNNDIPGKGRKAFSYEGLAFEMTIAGQKLYSNNIVLDEESMFSQSFKVTKVLFENNDTVSEICFTCPGCRPLSIEKIPLRTISKDKKELEFKKANLLEN